jgi:hypothetical protein
LPLPATNQERPLKVCHTCRFWSYKYKGFCQRLGQGVGRFWTCADWAAAGDEPASTDENAVAEGSAAP